MSVSPLRRLPSPENAPGPEELHRHYQAFADKARACTNFGDSHDDHDLLTVFEDLTQLVYRSLPPLACSDGCNQCCYVPFLVTAIEWQLIHAYLLELAPETLRAIIANAEAARPMAKRLAALRQWQLDSDDESQQIPPCLQCPMLIQGSCQIYPVRPLICRSFGLSSIDRKEGDTMAKAFYGCNLAKEHIQQRWPQATFVLPHIGPFCATMLELNRQQAGSQAFLVEWLWNHVESGELLPTPRRQLPA